MIALRRVLSVWCDVVVVAGAKSTSKQTHVFCKHDTIFRHHVTVAICQSAIYHDKSILF